MNFEVTVRTQMVVKVNAQDADDAAEIVLDAVEAKDVPAHRILIEQVDVLDVTKDD